MIKVIVCGASGRMGQRIINLIAQDKETQLAGAVEVKGHPALGREIEAGLSKVKIVDDLSLVIKDADVIIDFTNAESTLSNLAIVKENKKKAVIGTTGLTDEETAQVRKISKDIACVLAPNMSMGVNLLFKLVDEAARALSDYDVEITEAHHNKKKDAPSGTAKKLAEIIEEALNRDISKDAVYGRSGVVGERKKNEIGIHAVRAGDIVGEHTVTFASTGERLELTHRAHSRDTFASGAVTAAKWLKAKKTGLYDMQDVLGLK
ncbi:MAG: 4-hydroxy-tetrahydrodipicolinate reductase [bacterium]